MALDALDWFPKRFSPGDMDGTGGDRLLGRSQLSPLEILIRETAQNSWDARSGRGAPEFGISFRRTTPRLRTDLVSLLGNGRTEDLRAKALDQRLRLVEVYDRGTVGLDGPVDLRPVRGDGSTNYQDLILKLGVANHEGVGGGTYGFGKTAAFAYSRMGTIIYWTRCCGEDGVLEHRFIVSAIRGSYTQGDAQFTGRHWWGVVEGETVLPVRGERAAQLGAALFERGFDGEETGTSVLIIDPRPLADPTADDETVSTDNDAQDRLFAEQARNAIRMHLWPKLVPAPGDAEPPMRISLTVDGRAVELVDDPRGILGMWAAGLDAVRAVEDEMSGQGAPRGAKVRVLPIKRYSRVLGHLALVRYPRELHMIDADDLDPSSEDPRVDRICLMRNQAELVVTTATWFDRVPDDGLDWLAVYKPTKESDRIYAASEPPAHDDWVSSGAEDEVGRIVRLTQRKVRDELRSALFPDTGEASSDDGAVAIDAGDLARRLSSLLPEAPDSIGGGRRAARSSAPRHRAARAEVVASPPFLVGTTPDGAQHQRIGFRVSGQEQEIAVRLEVSQIGDQGVREPIAPELLGVRWSGDARRTDADTAVALVGRDCWVEFFGPPRRALRIDLGAVSS